MKARHLISAFCGVDLSTFSASQNLRSKNKFALRCGTVFLIAVLFLPALTFGQEDTLILVGSNTDVNSACAVSAYNKNAFVADFASGLKVIDYSDPENPSLVTTYPEFALDIEIRDSLAYYVGDCFFIKDISDPLEPDTIGQCCCYANAQLLIHVFDTLALTLLNTPIEYNVLLIIGVSDPANPHLLSQTWPTGGTMHWGDMYKKDNYIYWADRAFIYESGEELGRIIVFDITDPTNPVEIVTDTCMPFAPFAICIKDNYAHVALSNYSGDYGGLMVLDISDPYNIDSVGFFQILGGRVWNVSIEGNFAYVSAEVGLYVIDISDPSSPSLVTYYDTPDTPRDVFVDEPYVLVADHTSLLIFEASFLELIPGDVNGDGEVNLGDVVFLISYLYRGGPAPDPIERGDVNGDCLVDLGDLVYLISYLYRGGPAPQDGCVE